MYEGSLRIIGLLLFGFTEPRERKRRRRREGKNRSEKEGRPEKKEEVGGR
jgi:hypothetical protein